MADGATTILIQVAGQIGGVPAVAPDAVVLPLRALGPKAPGPNLMLLAGPSLDAARLSAVVRQALPGALVVSRAATLAALTTRRCRSGAGGPHPGDGRRAGFGALVLLLSLLLTARTREMTLAYLATMGLRRGQAQLLLAAETLPPVAAAAIGGVACAWLLVPLIGPSLNLAAFSGTGVAVTVTAAVLPLLAAAAGLLLAALLVLAAQALITYRRGSTRAVKIAD